MSTDPKIREVISYLETEFPDFEVALSEGSQGDPKLRLKLEAEEYVVIVQQLFLDEIMAEAIKEQLAEFRLAETLRDLGSFPVLVSVNGCIFA